MKEKRNYKKIISQVLAIISIIFIAIGTSYAIFTYVGSGEKENVITSGSVTIIYTEGNELQIENAMPISDEAGKALTGDKNVFTFTVEANLSGDTILAYEIAAVKKDTNTLQDNEVKLYLEKNNEEVLSPTHYIPIDEKTEVGSEAGSMVIDSGTFTESTTNYYTMKMWVDENTEITDVIKFYTITINVYAKEIIPTPPPVENSQIVKMKASYSSSYFLLENGELYVTGSENYGEFGDGAEGKKLIPTKIMDDVKMFSTDSHTLVVKNNGELYAAGRNTSGQLGDGTKTSKNEFVKIMDNVKEASAGTYFSLILTNDGEVYATGNNERGQLTSKVGEEIASPIKIADGVKQIFAGKYQSFIVKENGDLYAAGANEYTESGALGTGIEQDSNEFIKIMSNVKKVCATGTATIILIENGDLYVTGNNSLGLLGAGSETTILTPTKVQSNIKDIDAYMNRVLALTNDNVLYGVGEGRYGEFGEEINVVLSSYTKIMENVKLMTIGNGFSIIVKEDGTVYGSGSNNLGQLGNGTNETKKAFTKIDFYVLKKI